MATLRAGEWGQKERRARQIRSDNMRERKAAWPGYSRDSVNVNGEEVTGRSRMEGLTKKQCKQLGHLQPEDLFSYITTL